MTLGVMIVDSRHNPTADDCTMAQWFRDTGRPMVVVANKLDKLKKSEIGPNLQRIRETLELDEETIVIPFSAEKGDRQGGTAVGYPVRRRSELNDPRYALRHTGDLCTGETLFSILGNRCSRLVFWLHSWYNVLTQFSQKR